MSNPSSFRTLKTLLVSTIVISLAACSSVPQEQADSSQSSTTPQTTATSPETTSSPAETAANPSPAETTVADVPKVEEITFKEFDGKTESGFVDTINSSNQLKQALPKTETIVIQGWAMLPMEKQPADKVLITLKDGKSILSMATVDLDRKDVSDHFKNPALTKSGWEVKIDPKTLPSDTVVLEAWAYNSKTKEAYPLNNNPELTLK